MVRQEERRAGTVAAILQAAEKEFGTRGFDATTIDTIAARAGVAKGAVYHHFQSKEEIFEQVLDQMFAAIARDLPAKAAKGKDMLDSLVKGTEAYLFAVTAPQASRILLIDGPAVLGWNRWREIDQHHFGRMMKSPMVREMRTRMKESEIEALLHLVTGAITEAALVAAAAGNPRKKARELAGGLRLLLAGLAIQIPKMNDGT
jgi:AcrR family transcriptional regulator